MFPGKLIKAEMLTMLLVNIAYCKNDSWLVNCNWAGRTINNEFPNVQSFPEFGGSCNWHVPGSSVYELLHKRFWFLWVMKLWIQGCSHTWPRESHLLAPELPHGETTSPGWLDWTGGCAVIWTPARTPSEQEPLALKLTVLVLYPSQ